MERYVASNSTVRKNAAKLAIQSKINYVICYSVIHLVFIFLCYMHMFDFSALLYQTYTQKN